MKNIWTRHLEPASVLKGSDKNPFLAQLQTSEDHRYYYTRNIEERTKNGKEPLEAIPLPEVTAMIPGEGRQLPDVVKQSPEAMDISPGVIVEHRENPPFGRINSKYIFKKYIQQENPPMRSDLPEVHKVTPDIHPESIEDVHDYTGEGVELMRWTSKSHKGHELRLNTYPDDGVRLIELTSGKFVLQYSIAGTNIENVPVDSVKEADAIIGEDNDTTGELYPDSPELKWKKAG